MVMYSDIRKFDTSNGCGISSSIFFSGCTHKCNGCFNKASWDFCYGNKYDDKAEDLFISYLNNPHVNHASLLGGEVFQQDLNVIFKLVERIKNETKKLVWVWSGYTFDELLKNNQCVDILKYVDVLVDGRFDINKKDITLKFKGSSNQRIINVQESLKQGKVINYIF